VADLDSDIDALLGQVVRGETVPELAQTPRGRERVARAARRGRQSERVEPTSPAPLEPPAYVDPRSLPVRFTRLKTLALSPAHYRHACQKELDDSLALRLGAGSHAMLFEQPVVCYPHVRNGKRWEAFEAEHAGKVILSSTEWRRAAKLVEAVRRNAHAMRVLFDGTVREVPIDWQRAGRACRSTPDALAKRWITDLKSTKCAEPEWFAGEVMRRYYHAQLAFYSDAAACADVRPEEAFIVAVESTEPHPVTVFHLTPELLELGTKITVAWFEQLLGCEASDHWPEYTTHVVPLDVPPERDVFDQVELVGL
jgi:hypothetical protein